MTKFELTKGERNDALWKKLEAHLQSELARLREVNDDPAATDTEIVTARRRGEIAALKRLIKLGVERLEK